MSKIEQWKYEHYDSFIEKYWEQLSDNEDKLIKDIPADYGFEYIEVTSNWSISVYTMKETPLENTYWLQGVQWKKFRWLIIRD